MASCGPSHEALDACDSAPGELAVFLLQLDPNIAAPRKRSSHQRAARARERVEHAADLGLPLVGAALEDGGHGTATIVALKQQYLPLDGDAYGT